MINHYAIPPNEDGGTRHYSLAKYMADYEWDVSIIASNVDHKTGRKREDIPPGDHIDFYSRVRFLWLDNLPYPGSSARRMLGMLHFAWRCLVAKKLNALERPDVIMGSTVHPFAALGALFLAKRHNVPFVFEIRDLWPQTLIDSGYISSRSVICFIMRKLERLLISRARLVVTLLPFVSNYIEGIGFSSKEVLWVPNGVDLDYYPDTIELTDQPHDRLCLMYLGAHGTMNDLETIIQALAIYKNQYGPGKVYLRLLGSGPLKNSLIDRAATLGLDSDDIVFEAAVAKSEIPEISLQADAFVISVLDLPKLYRFGISMNKLSDYMAAGKPVLIATAAANNPVEEAGCGYTSPPEQPDVLAENLNRLVNLSPEDRNRLGQKGRAYVEINLSYHLLAKRMSYALDQLRPGS